MENRFIAIKMKLLLINIIIISLFSYASCQNNQVVQNKTVNNVDLLRYQGTWYEIARLPFRAEAGLVNVTATYTLKDNGKISVVNQGFKNTPTGKRSRIEGVAWLPNSNETGHLKVRFFWPFSAHYLIYALDEVNYEYALVGTPSLSLAWILSKKPELSPEIYNRLVEKARSLGADTDKFIKVTQVWNKSI